MKSVKMNQFRVVQIELGMPSYHIVSDKILQDGKELTFVFSSVQQETIKLLHGVRV